MLWQALTWWFCTFEGNSWSSYYEWTSGWYTPGKAVLNAIWRVVKNVKMKQGVMNLIARLGSVKWNVPIRSQHLILKISRMSENVISNMAVIMNMAQLLWPSYYEWTSGWYTPGKAVLNAVKWRVVKNVKMKQGVTNLIARLRSVKWNVPVTTQHLILKISRMSENVINNTVCCPVFVRAQFSYKKNFIRLFSSVI